MNIWCAGYSVTSYLWHKLCRVTCALETRSCHCGSGMFVFIHKFTSNESNKPKISIRNDLQNGKISSTVNGVVKLGEFLPYIHKYRVIGMS